MAGGTTGEVHSADSAAMTTMEFGVNMTCQSCVKKTQSVLSGNGSVKDVSVDLAAQRVVLTSSLPSEDVKSLIETTGKRAVLLGMGAAAASTDADVRPVTNQADARPKAAAVAMLGGLIGSSTKSSVVGVVRFSQGGGNGGGCVIDGTIDGLRPGSDHALAIHECGDISNGCESTGDCYDRSDRQRTPEDADRRVGDLGNVKADTEGRASFKFVDRLVDVNDIIGRSVVIAEGPNDLGKGSNQMSKMNANCGRLLSCGIIARSAGLFENTKRICACDGVSLWDERDKPLVGPERSADTKSK